MDRRAEKSDMNIPRAGLTELENHVVDEFVEGHVSRREFVTRATVFGMSATALGSVLAACGGANKAPAANTSGSSSQATSKPGATIRASIVTPTTEPNPLLVNDTGGVALISQTGEFLIVSEVVGGDLRLRPVLATSWRANADASVWTFRLRKGVRFHDGQAMTARDVAYSFKLQSDPKSVSNALSTFKGVLSPDGVHEVDDFTIAFHLEAPNGNFPYLCSSDNYNMIILPHGYDPHDWPKTFIGTGPFKLKNYTSQQSAAFVRNPDYWGAKALPTATEISFYDSVEAQVLALQGSDIDVVTQFSAQGGEALLNSSDVNVIALRSSAHRELSMRTDVAPFTDPRVRQAVALCLDRPAIAKALFRDYAQVGNDSPFAPIFPSTDSAVPQRVQDLAKAKQLLAAAGHPDGFSTKLYTESLLEIPALVQIIKQQASKISVDITLDIETASRYYGKAVPGQSDWLDGTMSLVDYAHRGVPNVFLEAPLETNGVWNAARFNDPKYDALVKQYVAAVDLSSQRSVAGRIERLLLAETPIIYPYFYSYLAATTSDVSGVRLTPTGQLFLQAASIA
jgi:peptide/nickel transport system substrate-binding protein